MEMMFLHYKRLPKFSAIKVIDFGGTAYEQQDHNYIVSATLLRYFLVCYCFDCFLAISSFSLTGSTPCKRDIACKYVTITQDTTSSKRLTAREALKHPFFTRDQYMRFLLDIWFFHSGGGMLIAWSGLLKESQRVASDVTLLSFLGL